MTHGTVLCQKAYVESKSPTNGAHPCRTSVYHVISQIRMFVSELTMNALGAFLGCVNLGFLYKSLHFAVPAYQAVRCPARCGPGIDGEPPDDSPVNGSFFDDDSLLFLSQPNVKPSHGGPACQTWLPGRPRDIFHPEKSVELVLTSIGE